MKNIVLLLFVALFFVACDDDSSTGPVTPGIPELTSHTSTSEFSSRKPELKWTAAQNATAYQLQISANQDFSSTIIDMDDLNETTYTPQENLTLDQTHYWRVRATGENNGEWSAVGSFIPKKVLEMIDYDDLVTGSHLSQEELISYAKFKNNSDKEIVITGSFVINELKPGHTISICTDVCYPAKTIDFVAPGKITLPPNEEIPPAGYSGHAYCIDYEQFGAQRTPGTNIVTYKLSVDGMEDEYLEFQVTYQFN